MGLKQQATADENSSALWPVDGHVHFHSLSCVGETLDAGAENFRAVASRATGLLGALLLAQAADEHVFEQLAERRASYRGWNVEPVASEPHSLLARKGGSTIAIVCGRQVRARDGLEVLGLGTRLEFPDGNDFLTALDTIRASEALTVVPWGFGKWLGSRGQQVRASLGSTSPLAVSFGDNGGRLRTWGVPALIRQAEAQGFRVLPGSDTFPFGKDYKRVGAFGFFMPFAPDESAPWTQLRAWYGQVRQSPSQFGVANSPMRFLFNQVGMRFYNQVVKPRQSQR